VFASCSHARALAAGLTCQDHISISTDQFSRVHKKKFDEMLRKLDSIEYAGLFKPTPALHYEDVVVPLSFSSRLFNPAKLTSVGLPSKVKSINHG